MQFFRQYANTILQQLPANRLLALDVFRGITITAMILVNNPGSWSYVYPPLLHAQWHGWTPTDLIFPFFVFIVGVSIAIVHQRESQQQTPTAVIFSRAVVRAAKLFGLGLFLAIFYYNFLQPDYDWLQERLLEIRIPGVLQRLGIVYLFTVMIVHYCSARSQLLILTGILVGYYLALAYVPYTTSDGQTYVGLLEFGNSLPAWLDHTLIGATHLYYGRATPFAFDPEGILSTLPSIASCLFGVWVGRLILDKQTNLNHKVKLLGIVGLLLLLAGEVWAIWFPINKALWTSSYVLLTAGWAMAILAALIWLIDKHEVKAWSAPFVVFGANAIFFFMFSGILARILIMIPAGDSTLQGWLYQSLLLPLFGEYNGSLAFAILFLMVSYALMHWLYKKHIFFKV